MQTVVAAKAYTPESERRSRNKFFALLVLFTLWFILCRQVSGEWSVNEQYNYGWFVPFFAGYLFWLRWQDRPMEGRAPSRPNLRTAQRPSLQVATSILVIALLLLFPLRLFEIGNPDWRPLSWLHAAITVFVTLALIWKLGGKPWLMHFAFPVAFIFVAVPWVTPVEVQFLRNWKETSSG